jgi:hypothetical protein
VGRADEVRVSGRSRIAIAAVAGAAGVIILCSPARAQVELPGDPVPDPQTTVTVVGDTPDATSPPTNPATTAPGTVPSVEETVDSLDQTVDTVEDTADGATDVGGGLLGGDAPVEVDVDGVVPEDPVTGVSGQVPDLVGSLLGEPGPGPGTSGTGSGAASVPGAQDVLGTRGTVAGAADTAAVDGAASAPGAGTTSAARLRLPVTPGPEANRPFILAARDVRTFGLPLVVALLLAAYLVLERWLGGHDPVAVAVTVRDELRRFE